MQRPFFSWFRAAPSRRHQSWRDLSRFWVLLCLLPMLLMSISNAAPHSHEIHALTNTFGADRSQASPIGSVPSADDGTDGTEASANFQILASHLDAGHEVLCLLCVWAGVAGACLMVALAISLRWPLLRTTLRAPVSSLLLSFLPRSLRSRAPPL